MSLQATRRKHCDQAHPYQRNLKEGISLFGRETPAYILKEVNRRQLADRGTSSLWAKLATDYGPRHANFIVKHGTKFPISRNDRNSWSNIVQEFTEKKRIRPVSAPNTRQELQTPGSITISNNNRCKNKSNRVASARARLTDIATRKDKPMPVFQRSGEIQAVIGILQDGQVARLRGKLKKGERRKAAEAAMRAESFLHPQSDRHDNAASSQSSLSVISHDTGSGRHCVPSAANGVHRRRQNPAAHRRQRTTPKAGSLNRQPMSKVRPRTASTVRSSSSSKIKRPRSAGSAFKHRTPNLVGGSATDSDLKLGIPKARSRIYSFGTTAATGADVDGGGSGHQDAMLRAIALDAELRSSAHNSCSASAGDETAAISRSRQRGKQRDKNKGGASSTECLVGNTRNHDANGRCTKAEVQPADVEEKAAHTGIRIHLGAIDISKLTTVLSHEGVRGDNRATADKRSGFHPDCKSTSGGARATDGGKPSVTAALGNKRPSSRDRSESDDGEAVTPRPETSMSGESSTTSGSGGEDGNGEDGGSLDSDESKAGESTVAGIGGQPSRAEGVLPDGSAKSRQPKPECLRGRYSRAITKSKSAFDAKRAAAAAMLAARRQTLTSPSAVSVGGTRCSTGFSEESSGAKKSVSSNSQEGGRAKGGRRAATVASWRDKLSAVQRRRAALECSMREEATRLAESRAKKEKQARVSCHASVSISVSVRGTRGFFGMRGRHCKRKIATATPPSARVVRAATTIQRAFRHTRQNELWLGNQCDRDYVAHLNLDKREDEQGGPDAPERRLRRLPSDGTDPISSTDDCAIYRAKKLHLRHVAVRTKRMVRGYVCCTQARFLLLQLLWDRTEGNILGERRSKRAAAESRAAATIQQLSQIRRIAVGLIKMQNSVQLFKMEHQSKQAKKNPKPTGAERRQGGRTHGGGGCTFETAKQARSEKQECEAILREHGRRGRRLVAESVRDRFLRDLLYSYRRQHIIRDQTEYLFESSRPPLLDSRDIKRMLACPDEEMHKFSDPKNYRTRPRYTRLALPLREIEGAIQDTIASHVKSEYRDKLKETLGTASNQPCGGDPEVSTTPAGRAPHQLAVAAAAAASARVEATGNATGRNGPAEMMAATTDTITYQQRRRAEQADPVVPGSASSPTTATPSSSQRTNEEQAAATMTSATGQRPVGTTATRTTSEDRGWRRKSRGGVGKVVQLTAAIA